MLLGMERRAALATRLQEQRPRPRVGSCDMKVNKKILHAPMGLRATPRPEKNQSFSEQPTENKHKKLLGFISSFLFSGRHKYL
jgi:hypothetical protein